MNGFHINKNGEPAPCHAKRGNCPLGGDSGIENHFDTAQEAQDYINKINEDKHSLLPGIQKVKNDKANNETKEIKKEIQEVNSDKRIYYVHDDGTYSFKPNENDKEQKAFEDWGDAERYKNEVSEKLFSKLNGIAPPISEEDMSIEEQQDFYLSQEPIEKGVYRGPHKVDKGTLRQYVITYLGNRMNHSNNFEKAYKATLPYTDNYGGYALILDERTSDTGIKGLIGMKSSKKGILLKHSVVRDNEKDKDKKDYQLPKVYEIHYLDEMGIKSKMKEFAEYNKDGVGGRQVNQIFKY